MSLFGIPLKFSWTFFAILGYLCFPLSEALFTVPFILSVYFLLLLPHEFGHVFAAKQYGLKTHAIHFHVVGMMAHIPDVEVLRGKQMIWLAIAGPLYNFIIAIPLTILMVFTESKYMDYLAISNWFIAIFNLLPCFPMDGGRITLGLSDIFGWDENVTIRTAGCISIVLISLFNIFVTPLYILTGLMILFVVINMFVDYKKVRHDSIRRRNEWA